MDKKSDILIIGFGSIGQRHYKNLSALGYKNIWVYDVDFKKIPAGIKTIGSLSQNNLFRFKIAFVCNPTSLHVKTALKCAESGCHLFIEKPLSNSVKGADKLVLTCKKNNLTAMVACNLRFEPCLRKIKEFIDKGKLGRIYAIYLEYGRFLPYQRQGADYTKIYASQKKMGGGIILDDIHDFDLLFWFNNFEKIKQENIVSGKLSNLKINVEDIAAASFIFNNKVLGSIRCDYLQQYKHKNCKIIGEKGNLNWNFRDNEVYFEYFSKDKKEKAKKVFQARLEDSNQPYMDELKYFIDCVKTGKKTFNDLERSLEVLKQII